MLIRLLSTWQKVGVLVDTAKMDSAYNGSLEAYKKAKQFGFVEKSVPYHEWVNGSILFSTSLTKAILTDYEYVDVTVAVEAVNDWWKAKRGYPGLSVALTIDDKGKLVFVLTLRQ